DELKDYFLSSMDIPHGKGFESVSPMLNDYSYPSDIIKYDTEYFNLRHKIIKESLLNNSEEIIIKYIVPWTSTNTSGIGNLDLIFSQAVMEHIEDIAFAYKEMYKYLKKGGIISHQIDFKTHEMTKDWNGHWFISEPVWKFLLRGRKYPINRLPLSSHVNMIKNVGFEIKSIIPVHRKNPFYNNSKTKVPSVSFTEEDFITSGALIQAIKL